MPVRTKLKKRTEPHVPYTGFCEQKILNDASRHYNGHSVNYPTTTDPHDDYNSPEAVAPLRT